MTIATLIAFLLLMASFTIIAMPVKAQTLPLKNSGGEPLPAGTTPDTRVRLPLTLALDQPQ